MYDEICQHLKGAEDLKHTSTAAPAGEQVETNIPIIHNGGLMFPKTITITFGVEQILVAGFRL